MKNTSPLLRLIFAPLAAILALTSFAPANGYPTLYWLGTNGTTWTPGNNWSQNSTSGDPASGFVTDAYINFSAISTNSSATDLGGDLSISSLTIDTTDAVGISGGNLTVSGATTINIGTLTIGNGGTTGALIGDITNNAALAFSRSDDSTHSGNISGTGSLTKNGSGILTLSGNNTYTGDTTIRNGTLALPVGGSISSAGNMTIGSASGDNGALNISGGNVSNAVGSIGNDARSVGAVTVNGTGSSWINSDELYVGRSGSNNTLLINNEGNVANGFGYIGNNATSNNNTVTVNGTGSSWINSADLSVGTDGSNNTLLINNGGNVTNTIGYIGNNATSNNNTVTVNGTGSKWINSSTLYVGYKGSNNTLLINNGGNVTNRVGYIGVSTESNNNTVTVNGTGSSWINSEVLYVGWRGNNNALLINNGGNVRNSWSNIGTSAISNNNTVTVNGTGSSWINSEELYVGDRGSNNTLLIANGGNVTSRVGFIGYSATSNNNTVTVNGTGSKWINSFELYAGRRGNNNTLLINNGGNVTNTIGYIGYNATSNNNTVTVSGTGSSWINRSELYVGYEGSNNALTVADGGAVSASADSTVGYYGSGTLNLTGGNFSIAGGAGNLTLARESSSTGVLSIGNGTAAGHLNAASVIGGTGTAVVNFNHTGNHTFTPVLDGNLTVNILGSGTTTLSGNNTIRDLTFTNTGNLAIQTGYSLTLSQGQLAVENGSSVVSGGTLETPGNFNKTGAGELDVQSTLAVNGTASIDAGLLSVNGQLIADSVVVNPNATLGGAGLIIGNVNVNGNLSPGNSPGTLAIAGNLALTGANSTLIEIASPTNFDRIVVSGSANLGGALNVVEFGGFEIAYGQQYAFLTAGGGISGEFDTINAPETFRGRFLNLGTTGVLLIAPDTYTRVAVTPNQREVAQALDSFIPTTSGDRETVSIALDLQTAEQYPYAFEQIMPGFYESLANIAIEQTYNQAQLLTQRLGTVRLGATGFQAIGLSQPIKYDKDGKSASDAKTASPIVESAIDTKWNSWVIANGEFSLSRGLSGVPNYNNNAGGFLVGADYRLSENFAAGLFAGYEYSYAKYDGGSSTAGNSALFGLYGSYTHEDGYYADAIVSGGYTGFQTRRSIEFSTIDRTARANPNSGQFSAALNFGKDFEIGKFTLGPIIGAQYTYAGIGGFTESGADSLDLALGQQNANSLRTNLGARLAYNWEVGSNITLIPEVRGFWMHEFLNNPRNISSSLEGGGPSFDYETSAPYRNSVFGGVGISAKFADRWSASVFYNVNFGAEGYTNNIISTSLGFSF